MEIVLGKRPLKKKVRLFNFGKRMDFCNSSQTSAKVLKLLQPLINFCKSIVTRKTPVQTIGYIKSFDYINFSVNKLYSNYFVHTFILYIISIGE